jgi:hypothetical protein
MFVDLVWTWVYGQESRVHNRKTENPQNVTQLGIPVLSILDSFIYLEVH